MMRNMNSLLVLVTLAAVLTGTASTSASEKFAFSLNIGFPRPVVVPEPVVVAPPTRIERRWVEGHYEQRTQTVLVEPEHLVRQYVPPTNEIRYDQFGRPYTMLVYYRDVVVAARYETRTETVWVPGYWQEVTVQAPAACAPVAPAPVFWPGVLFGGRMHEDWRHGEHEPVRGHEPQRVFDRH